jgi:tetratricopeptide (TPR) repeat protein
MVFCRERTRIRNAGAEVAAAIILCVFTPFARAGEDPAKTARYFLDRGDFIQAVHYFEAALANKPEQKDLRALCAFAYLKQNQLDKAEELLKKEIELAPDSQNARSLLGLVYFRQGRGAEAEAACRESLAAFAKKGTMHRPLVSGWGDRREEVARENHNAGLPYFILGLLNKAKGRFAEAVENFGKASELGYDPLACQLHILDAELGRQSWESVSTKAPVLWKKGGGVSAEARTLQAIAFDQLRADQEALDCLKQAAALKPLEPWALKNLALYHLNRAQFEEALPLIRKVLWLAPLDFQARFLLGQAESRRHIVQKEHRIPFTREFVEAFVPVYRHVFARNPKDIAREVQNYALELIRAGMLPEASQAIKNFLDLYDQSASLNYDLAQLYNATDNLREALRYALKAIELQNNYRDAYDLLGNVFFKAGNFEDSVTYYRLAVIFAPTDAMGYYNLGCACRQLKDDEEAEKNWLLAVKYDKPGAAARRPPDRGRRSDDLHVDLQVRAEPVSFDAYFSLASLYLEVQKPEAALDAFAKAAEIMPLRQEPYLEMGRLYLKLKGAAEAKECFDKYIALGGDEAKVKAILK